MEDLRVPSGSRLRLAFFHIVADGVVIALIFLTSLGTHEISKLLTSNWTIALSDRIERWVVMACVTLFSVKVLAEISIEIYASLKKGLSTARLRAKQFRWTAANEAFSYIVGIFGFAVVYALVHRADLVENLAAKWMIYIAALVLFSEILYMVTATVKDRALPEARALAEMRQ